MGLWIKHGREAMLTLQEIVRGQILLVADSVRRACQILIFAITQGGISSLPPHFHKVIATDTLKKNTTFLSYSTQYHVFKLQRYTLYLHKSTILENHCRRHLSFSPLALERVR